MGQKALKDFIAKFRQSEQIATIKAVDYLSNGGVSNIIAEYNRKQMLEGEDSNEQDLGQYGAWRTMQRDERGLQTGFIDLKFDGNFHESIYVEGEILANRPAVVINTTSPEDWNAIKEDDRFKDALGLKGENRDKVGMMIALEIQKGLLNYYKP